MTVQTQSEPTSMNAASRIVALVLGILLPLTGVGIGAVGGSLLGVFGSDETVASGSHPISTRERHWSRSVADISDSSAVAGFAGDPRIRP